MSNKSSKPDFIHRLTFRILLYGISKEQAKSEEIIKTYYDNGRIHTITRKKLLYNGGTYRESRVYGKRRLVSLSQRATYKKEVDTRYVSWSNSGKKRLEIASRFGVSFYFNYYPAYYRR